MSLWFALLETVAVPVKHDISFFEQAEDSLASSNLVHVVGHLYGCRVLEAATVYSLLDHLKDRFSEQDVALIFALLNSVGLQLRSDDPAAMKVSFLEKARLSSAQSETSW